MERPKPPISTGLVEATSVQVPWLRYLEQDREWAFKQLALLVGRDRHLRGCDKDMGDSHGCTCGTRRIYRALNGLPPDVPSDGSREVQS